MKIAIVGGTGNMGFGLGLHFAKVGHEVIIGSRTEDKAQESANTANRLLEKAESYKRVKGMANSEAVKEVDLVIISVPAAAHKVTIESIADTIKDKNVLDVTIPMAFKPIRFAPPEAGANALETLSILGEDAKIAAGFHTVSATLLQDPSAKISGDTLIVGNDKSLKELVISLANEIGYNGYDAGSLEMSKTVESLTPMLIGMNKRYGSKHIGIELTGVTK